VKAITEIRAGIGRLYEETERIKERALQLQKESLGYFEDDPDAAVETDQRLVVPYVFAGYLGIAVEFFAEALKNLEKIKDVREPGAIALVEQWRTESNDSDLEGA
jgi:hypothetical protein